MENNVKRVEGLKGTGKVSKKHLRQWRDGGKRTSEAAREGDS